MSIDTKYDKRDKFFMWYGATCSLFGVLCSSMFLNGLQVYAGIVIGFALFAFWDLY